MSKKIVIGVGIGVAVIFGVGAAWFVVNNKQEPVNSVTNSQQATTTQPQSQQESSSIKSIMAAGANKKCTFTTTAESGAKIVGTIYISADKKMRGEYNTTSEEGKSTTSNMIITQTEQFMWNPETKEGVKMNINTATTNTQPEGQPSTPPQSGGLDTEKNYDFKCTDWKLDEAMFVAPSDVTFTDFSNIKSKIGQ
jgi:hypothetical protein